ncbi:tetratricopeptide repeat protein [Sphingobium limneticum]|uniref:tetratricopeptide repeat protein n=1 Tax=Sphingobium limneticum TaxID=1007511 RepID=UPI003D0057BE
MAQAYKFNPGFQSDAEAVSNFIVRQSEFNTILAAFADRGLKPRQLLVAPRGAGKTTLCRRLLAEIRTHSSLAKQWQPIFLGEESYTVTTPGEFFLECLFHLADQLSDPTLKALHDAAAGLTDERDLTQACLSALRSFARTGKKRLLVIVENFHILLNDQLSAGANELIDLLSDTKLFGVLATSVSQTSVENDDPRLSGFDKLFLRPLSLEECHELWTVLTDKEVPKTRIRPLQILTGGSPRLIHILADFMKTPSLRDLMDNLNLLIDQNTEYFKSQLDALPAVERKVFASLLDAWDPSSAKQIAEAARVNINTASAMLGRLSDRGAVLREAGRGRSVLYYAAERLFNIYYLMRRRSHPSSRVRALVAFMTEYYDRDELVDTTAKLVREACLIDPASRSDYHSAFDAILTVQPEAVRSRILAQTPADFMRSFRADTSISDDKLSEFVEASSHHAEPAHNAFDKLLEEAQDAVDDDRYDDARTLIEQAIAIDPTNSEPYIRRALIAMKEDDFDEAIADASRAVELDETVAAAHALLGMFHFFADHEEAAEHALRKAIALDPEQSMALNGLGDLRARADDNEEAIALYRRVAALGDLPDSTAARFARLLMQQHENDEAETILREALAAETPGYEPRRALVDLLRGTDRTDEAIAVLREAAHENDDWRAWADLGSFLVFIEEEPAEAVASLEASVEKGADSPSIYRMLARAFRSGDHGIDAANKVAEDLVDRHADEAWAWLGAGDIYLDNGSYDRAEGAYRKAAAFDDGDYARVRLAQFIVDQAYESADVDVILEEAVAAAQRIGACGPMKDLAELLIHRGDDEQAILLLDEALGQNERCACSLVMRGDVAARQGDNEMATLSYNSALDFNGEDVAALTGLARIAEPSEAEALISRAIEADPSDPKCLLARAMLSSRKLSARIDDVSEALDRDPELTEARLILAPLAARNGDMPSALEHFGMALPDLDSHRELIPAFVNVALDLVRHGLADEVSEILSGENGRTVEPLAVALMLARGENPPVAKEILEVARDIADRLAASLANAEPSPIDPSPSRKKI